MSNNKQSSIEWLYEKMFVHRGLITIEEFNQAKAMHKKEITQAWKKGDGEFDNCAKEMSLEYYNETFGGSNE